MVLQCLFDFLCFFSVGRKKLRKIFFENLISGRVGRGRLAWKIGPQDSNLEVGGSYNVCSIFQVFRSDGASEIKKNFV